MMKAWQIRENFELIDRIAISRRTFEELFTHTKERIEFTFNGWDGKSYNGESGWPASTAATFPAMRIAFSSGSARPPLHRHRRPGGQQADRRSHPTAAGWSMSSRDDFP